MMDTDLRIDTKKKVPSLRFAGFDEEWKEKRLGEVAEITGGGTPETNIKDYWDGPIQWFTPTEIKSDFVLKSSRTITELGLKKSSAKILPKGAILLTTRATIGEASIALEECTTNQGFQSLVAKENNHNIFLFNWIKYNKFELIKRANGSTFPEISKSEIEQIPIHLPALPEQQKIASFLTAVDKKLQALKQQKNLLEQYKKGMMQKIFSQEIRFKDNEGKGVGEWEMKKLGEIVDKKSSNISANKIEENTGRYIIYGASGILKKIDFYKEEDDYISIIKDGAGAGRLFYYLGRSSVLSTMEIITPKIGLNTYYLYCLLSNIDFTKYITGSTIPHIYFKDYSSEICNLPTLPEQTKIAHFLSAIDEKISHCQVRITKMEQYKKGLLQQLFV